MIQLHTLPPWMGEVLNTQARGSAQWELILVGSTMKHHGVNITTPPPPPMDGRGTNHKQEGLHTQSLSWSGLEIKKILRWTNWRNIVARCKFLVASLYNVNDAAHSQFHAARFTKTRKIPRNSVEILSMSVWHIWNFFQLLVSQYASRVLRMT